VDRIVRHAIERADLENRELRTGLGDIPEVAPALVAAIRDTPLEPRQDSRHGPGVDVAPH
jgi:hypothetical protein